ncbi:polysaccharide deacetylase family protein [Microbacterium xylanilyticum]
MSVLVRPGVIEQAAPPAGDFRSRAVAGGRIPAWLYRSCGVYCADTTVPALALTYDDGPDPASTPGVLDMLERHGAPATFFVLSDHAAQHPEIVRRIVADGHELALHGADHRSLLTMSTAQARRTLREARDVVEQISGRPIRLYRPPYGRHTAAQARMIHRIGMRMVIWSGVADDWIDAPAATVARKAIARIFPGSILLLHDTRADPETLQPGERLPTFDRAEVLDRILCAAYEQGFLPQTVSGLLDRHPPVHSMTRERMRTP